MLSTTERYSDPEYLQRAAFASAIVGIWTAMPGYVVSYDATKVTVSVQPGIRGQVLKKDGTVSFVQMPVLNDVPVMFPRGGGCTLTFPIAAGDECLVIFSARSIDAWWQSGGIQAPSAARTHSLADGFAIIGPMSQANKIASISTTKTQLRSNDASTIIELDASGQAVKVTAPNGINLNGVTIDSSGNVNCPATVTATTDVIGGGKHLATHTHSGVTTGSGTSGPPV